MREAVVTVSVIPDGPAVQPHGRIRNPADQMRCRRTFYSSTHLRRGLAPATDIWMPDHAMALARPAVRHDGSGCLSHLPLLASSRTRPKADDPGPGRHCVCGFCPERTSYAPGSPVPGRSSRLPGMTRGEAWVLSPPLWVQRPPASERREALALTLGCHACEGRHPVSAGADGGAKADASRRGALAAVPRPDFDRPSVLDPGLRLRRNRDDICGLGLRGCVLPAALGTNGPPGRAMLVRGDGRGWDDSRGPGLEPIRRSTGPRPRSRAARCPRPRSSHRPHRGHWCCGPGLQPGRCGSPWCGRCGR